MTDQTHGLNVGVVHAGLAEPAEGLGDHLEDGDEPAVEMAVEFGRQAARLVLVAYLLVRHIVLGGLAVIEIEPLDNPLVDLQGIDRVLAALAVATRYAVLLVAPARLSADYSFAAIDVSDLPAVDIAGGRRS